MNDALMNLSNVDTAALLPASLTQDSDIVAMMHALDGFWKELAPIVPTLGVLATIDIQPEEVLDKLAYQFHVDYYETTWSIERKRAVVKDSIRIHRIAGTRGAVEDVINDIWGDSAIISEWWEHGGEPGTFEVTLINPQAQAQVDQFLASIRKVKRATDHLTVRSLNDVGVASANVGLAYLQYSYYRL